MKNNSPIDLKNQLLSVISQMQSVSHLFVETGKDFSRKLIIPGLFEPPVRTLRATIPENESHIFR